MLLHCTLVYTYFTYKTLSNNYFDDILFSTDVKKCKIKQKCKYLNVLYKYLKLILNHLGLTDPHIII